MPCGVEFKSVVNGCLSALLIGAGLCSVLAQAQDPLTNFPKNYWSVLDNDTVKVIRAHYGPHEKIGVHDHPGFATVFVYLNDSGEVRLDHGGDKSFSVVRPPTVKGSFRVVAGMAETHSIENLGDTSSDFFRVEMKHISLGVKEPFRGKAPANLMQGQDSVEFTDPELQIERIVCAGPSSCALKASSHTSLVIPFTPLKLTGDTSETMKVGDVQWLDPGVSDSILGDGGAPAHVLRLFFSDSSK